MHVTAFLPLMTALIKKPGLAATNEQLQTCAMDLMTLRDKTSNKVITKLKPGDPELLAGINTGIAHMVAASWELTNIDDSSSDVLSDIFLTVFDALNIDLTKAFDQKSLAIGIDTAQWVAKYLPPFISLRYADPEKKGKANLLLGGKPFAQNIMFIQDKLTAHVERVKGNMMVTDPDSDSSVGHVVSDLFATIFQTQFELLNDRLAQITNYEGQEAFLKEREPYPDGILIETSLEHLGFVLDICFPGTTEG